MKERIFIDKETGKEYQFIANDGLFFECMKEIKTERFVKGSIVYNNEKNRFDVLHKLVNEFEYPKWQTLARTIAARIPSAKYGTAEEIKNTPGWSRILLWNSKPHHTPCGWETEETESIVANLNICLIPSRPYNECIIEIEEL